MLPRVACSHLIQRTRQCRTRGSAVSHKELACLRMRDTVLDAYAQFDSLGLLDAFALLKP